MQGAILRPNTLPAADRGNGAATTPLVTRQCGSTSLLNGITAFEPGAAVGVHWHNCEESVLVLEGEATVEIDGHRHALDAGDTVWIPASVPHRFLNKSGRRMRIFWTYASVEATRTMAATGETHTIEAEHPGASRR